MNEHSSSEAKVYMVDDDAGFRKSLSLLLNAENLPVQAFASAAEFLAAYNAEAAGCLILDYSMPDMSGLELQEKLVGLGATLPIIMVTAHADVKTAVQTMKYGSFDLIEKPYDTEHLLARIHAALAADRRARVQRHWRESTRARIDALTGREREVLLRLVNGKTSKMIADELAICVSTVDTHRARITKKLQAATAADVTRITLAAYPDFLGPSLPPWASEV